MPGISLPAKTNDAALLDFVRAAYPKVIKKEFTDIASQYQQYCVAEWLKSPKQDTGTYLTWPVMYRAMGNAKQVQLYEPDSVSVQDVTAQAHAQWTHMVSTISWDTRELLMAQNNPERIFDLMKARRAATQLSVLELLEANLFGTPTTDAEIQTKPQGIPFWIQRDSSTTAAGAWNGGDPAGITGGAGGLATATYAGWKNWTAGYTLVATDDLVKKMRRTVEKLDFGRPQIVGTDIPDEGKFDPMIYVPTETKLDLEDVVAAQNDNLGFALDPTRNKATFYGVEIKKVPILDTSAWSAILPVYFIDKASFKAFVLKGNFFRESEPMMVNGLNHNQIVVHQDLSYQFICTNRRRNGVISKS